MPQGFRKYFILSFCFYEMCVHDFEKFSVGRTSRQNFAGQRIQVSVVLGCPQPCDEGPEISFDTVRRCAALLCNRRVDIFGDPFQTPGIFLYEFQS